MNKTIETGRLLIRPIEDRDAEDIFEYAQGANVGINAGWKPHENIEETIGIMKEVFLDQENVFGIELKESGKLIGTIGLIRDMKRENDNVLMLGYAIGENYWGKGYMTEAAQAVVRYGFERLHLDLISAYCYPFNARSKRVIEKCGFLYEGKLHQAEKRYDGTILDNECYCLLK